MHRECSKEPDECSRAIPWASMASASTSGAAVGCDIPYLSDLRMSPTMVIYRPPNIIQLSDALGMQVESLTDAYNGLPTITLTKELPGSSGVEVIPVDAMVSDDCECLQLSPVEDTLSLATKGLLSRRPIPDAEEVFWESNYWDALRRSKAVEVQRKQVARERRQIMREREAITRASFSSVGGQSFPLTASAVNTPNYTTPHSRQGSLTGVAVDSSDREVGTRSPGNPAVESAAQRTAKGLLRRARYNEIHRSTSFLLQNGVSRNVVNFSQATAQEIIRFSARRPRRDSLNSQSTDAMGRGFHYALSSAASDDARSMMSESVRTPPHMGIFSSLAMKPPHDVSGTGQFSQLNSPWHSGLADGTAHPSDAAADPSSSTAGSLGKSTVTTAGANGKTTPSSKTSRKRPQRRSPALPREGGQNLSPGLVIPQNPPPFGGLRRKGASGGSTASGATTTMTVTGPLHPSRHRAVSPSSASPVPPPNPHEVSQLVSRVTPTRTMRVPPCATVVVVPSPASCVSRRRNSPVSVAKPLTKSGEASASTTATSTGFTDIASPTPSLLGNTSPLKIRVVIQQQPSVPRTTNTVTDQEPQGAGLAAISTASPLRKSHRRETSGTGGISPKKGEKRRTSFTTAAATLTVRTSAAREEASHPLEGESCDTYQSSSDATSSKYGLIRSSTVSSESPSSKAATRVMFATPMMTSVKTSFASPPEKRVSSRAELLENPQRSQTPNSSPGRHPSPTKVDHKIPDQDVPLPPAPVTPRRQERAVEQVMPMAPASSSLPPTAASQVAEPTFAEPLPPPSEPLNPKALGPSTAATGGKKQRTKSSSCCIVM